MKKERADRLLIEHGLADDKDQAARLFMAGLVYSGEERIDKPGTQIARDKPLRLKEKLKFVSRGGLKLEHGADVFGVDFTEQVVLDIGSSTGGFTDLALQRGARKVYAVDSGTNQLHEKLRANERVISLEQTNFRTIQYDAIGESADIIVCDVSFISLVPIMDSAVKFCKEGTLCVFLIKPQFEAEARHVGKNGVVRDKDVHKAVCEKVITHAGQSGFSLCGLAASPVRGPKGNIEYLACFLYNALEFNDNLKSIIDKVVDEDDSYNRQTPR